MRRMKKWLALVLALSMAVPNISGLARNDVSAVYAAEETPETWEDWTNSLSADAEMAVQLTGDDQNFDGTRVLDVSEDYAEAIKGVSTGSIIMRFKANSIASHGVILGTRTSSADLPTDVSAKNESATGMVITNQDKFYLVYSYDRAGINGPHSFVDGDWHTVVLSGAESGKNIRLTIDGVEVWSISNRSDLAGMFSKQTGLDMVTIGGHTDGTNVVGGFNGSISDVIVTSAEISDEDAIAISAAGYSGTTEMGSSIATTMTNHSIRDNTWLFTGGEAVQGGFDQTRGIRNYIGQFEEYIRWTVGGSSAVYGRQRFTFSTAKAGQTIADIVNNFDAKVATFKTKAVVYMVGKEDYSQGADGVEAFKTNLKSFIDKSLALKDNGAFVIIQKPFAVNDTTANANIETYCAAVDAVADTYTNNADQYARLLVVDHYTRTKDDAAFKADKLSNDKLNAQGHLTVSQQFAEEVVNFSGTGYPKANVVLDRVEVAQPEEYLDVEPTATAKKDSLAVEIPEVAGVTEWNYELEMGETTVSGTTDKNGFEITGLAEGKDYVLKIQSADGKKQLVTTKGTITEGNTSQKNTQVLDEKQQKIADRMAKDEPMTWLFMGDSITHASGLTYGYDGIAQIFEEYVKEELGRGDDVVLNTAVANAQTQTTIEQLDLRLTNYTPDVVSIMLGTNDCSSRVNITVDGFETNMRTILDTIKTNYPNAVVILRSMTPVFNDGNRQPYMPSYMEVVKKLAEEYDTMYVDQYTALDEATQAYASWLPKSLFTDNLHPEANGHRIMAYQFIKACGLWTEDSPMTNVFYEMGVTEEASEVIPSFSTAPGAITISADTLKAQSGLALGSITVKATSKDSGQTYEVTSDAGEAEATIADLPYGDYAVEVSSYLTNTAKRVTFKSADVTVSDLTNVELTLEMGDTYQLFTTEEPVIAKQPDETIAKVTVAKKESESSTGLYDFDSSVASSLTSFSGTANADLDLSDVELVFTEADAANGIYKVQQTASGKYLVKTAKAYVELADNADAAANQLKFIPTTTDEGTTFKICRASDSSRYIVFVTGAMTYNTMGGVVAWDAGTYELTLLEKQTIASDSDIIPGYAVVSKITSGNTYLIAYIHEDAEGAQSAIVLYPKGSDNASQTKLVETFTTAAGYEITITPVSIGTTTAVVDEINYNINVIAKVVTPDDDSRDIPTAVLTATAGNEEELTASNTTEGSAEFVLDNNTATMWHTDWDGSSRDTHWIQFELSEAYVVDGLRYLPRNTGVNGVVTSYIIQTSNDGSTWKEAVKGSWDANAEWKMASFTGENVKYVRLKVEDAQSTNAKLFASALEIRLTGTKADAFVTPTPTATEAPQPTETEAPQPTVTEAPQPTVTEAPVPTETEAPQPTVTEAPQPSETPEVKDDVTTVFDDVYTDWYTGYVQYVYDNNLMTGIKGTKHFEPNSNITKAQVAQVLYNMEGQPEVKDQKVFTELNDVYDAEWYANAVAWAYNNGVVTGDLNTKKFNPNADVTREQLALMMFRYAGFKKYDVTATSDYEGLVGAEKISNWAAEGVSWAVGTGLISGVEANGVKDIAPQGNATRAQVAAILQRFCENVQE